MLYVCRLQSNDNVELVTRLQGCEHTSNDLMAKLSTREDELSVSEEAVGLITDMLFPVLGAVIMEQCCLCLYMLALL